MSSQAYPEHEKLKRVSDKSQAIGEFLEWLTGTRGVELMRRRTAAEIEALNDDPSATDDDFDTDTLIPFRVKGGFPAGLLAEYFEVDQGKLEAEKRSILAVLAAGSGKK